jgi:hypothetical protein
MYSIITMPKNYINIFTRAKDKAELHFGSQGNFCDLADADLLIYPLQRGVIKGCAPKKDVIRMMLFPTCSLLSGEADPPGI